MILGTPAHQTALSPNCRCTRIQLCSRASNAVSQVQQADSVYGLLISFSQVPTWGCTPQAALLFLHRKVRAAMKWQLVPK